MLTATILAIFYIPLFFVLVRRGVRDGLDLSPRAVGSAGERRRHESARAPLIALLLAGCMSMEPHYVRPDPAVPPSWPVGDPYLRQSEAALPAVTYQEIFRDPRLQALIEQALANNRDLMVAAANIAAAREQYRIQRAELFPEVDCQRRRHRHRTARRVAGPTLEYHRRRRHPKFRARPVRPNPLADQGRAQPLFRHAKPPPARRG